MDLPSRLSASSRSFRAGAQRQNFIQKVPQSVRRGLEQRYFVPDVVSIGPYHHGSDHLVEMEQIKEAVAHDFCHSSLSTVPQFLEAVRPTLQDARRCYADRFESINYNDFAFMMVVDGCFLLAVMAVFTKSYPEGLDHWSWTHGRMLRILKDILLFENQIPWSVLRALMNLRRVPVDQFVDRILAYFEFDVHSREAPARSQWEWDGLNPAHLLDLVHRRHLGGLPPNVGGGGSAIRYCDYARPFAPFTSAVELAEAGIHLHGSNSCRVTEVKVKPTFLVKNIVRLQPFSIGRLVLPRLALSWLPRCWLINMVALECVTDRSDNSGVSSYLAILGSLVRAERDVKELRSKRILFSTMSDQRTVEFFEGILDPLPRQELYLRTLADIVHLRASRSARSGIHAFYHRNRRTIITFVPLLSLLVAIVAIVVNNSNKHK
ncbi:hypothetical protein HU200_008018 [Digitaria exilis]|uniref:Uncharacterized protein n=1 Tax=Digitaria exilis TaxID=1010633 RepID=A0A835KQK1_9POAL|nr:hypothetical protein HU200_008018 [Digitaria exilis]CAB3484196.1 unnamed protein product [Digitaria exilis]